MSLDALGFGGVEAGPLFLRLYDPISSRVSKAIAEAMFGLGVNTFPSFDAFKKYYGIASHHGQHLSWHHLVLQRNKDKFGQEAIQNDMNLVLVEDRVHREINRYYNRL